VVTTKNGILARMSRMKFNQVETLAKCLTGFRMPHFETAYEKLCKFSPTIGTGVDIGVTAFYRSPKQWLSTSVL
jgi:hypothetical protein